MTSNQTTPALDSTQKRFKGSLAGTLVRTLLFFTFIPLALMAGAAYLRAQSLLREQAVKQSENLIVSQLSVVQEKIQDKEEQLKHLLSSSDFSILTELAVHANPKSNEFKQIRKSVVTEFENLDKEQGTPVFSQYMLVDTEGVVKVSTKEEWQGIKIADPSFLQQATADHPSIAVFNVSPLIENQFVLLTVLEYKTSRGSSLGYLIGVTDTNQINTLLEPLQALSPLAHTYFILPTGQFITRPNATSEFSVLENPTSGQKNKVIPGIENLKSTNITQPQAIDIKSADGKSALTQIQWFPAMHSGVAMEFDTSSVYSGLNSLAPFTIVLVLVTLLATSGVIYLLINRIITPLRGLAQITQEFSAGNWNSRAAVKSEDEVGLLASSYNQMADELSKVYRSLEEKVDERSRQIRTTAEIAQQITSFSNLGDMYDQTVQLLVQQFGFYQASIFLTDSSAENVEFKAGYGTATSGLMDSQYHLPIGSDSIIGWVGANNETRVVSEAQTDSLHLKNELLPETQSEAAVPISIGNLVLGVLDVQSTQPDAFSNTETVIMLQTLASQVAAAIQAAGLTETTQVNFEELSRLYRSSRLIAKAGHEDESFQISGDVLRESPYSFIVTSINGDKLNIVSASDENGAQLTSRIPSNVQINPDEIDVYLERGPVLVKTNSNVPLGLKTVIEALEFNSVAFIPVTKSGNVVSIFIMGTKDLGLGNTSIQPYGNFADLISITLEKIEAEKQTAKHLQEVESLASVSEAISTSSDLPSFFAALHEKIKQVIGDFSFIVALYDDRTDTISIPFSFEENEFMSIDPFPLGEGLTSILIKSRQPLLLVENTEQKAAELGAKIQGNPAKSWMGAPMMVQNKPVGALIIQDTNQEFAFSEENFTFFITLASQVAGVINNVRLLDESKRRSLQLETAAEIARDISGSLNLDELLIKAVNLIRERFDFYHAAVFLQDIPGEFAIIREATGEAGAQLKRMGHKIGVGSKSIVGFVTGRGEQLVVNDTSKDATYYANPSLPDTRAEAAFPLKVGERILGALDVQSTKAYAFTEDNLRSLQILADQMAIAVVNTELFAETQEHLSQHRLLHHITTTVASGTTLEEALESAVQGLQVTLGGDRVTILLADKEKKKLEVKASMGYAEDTTKAYVAIGSGITGWVAANRRLLRVRDVTEDPRYIQISSNTRSELAIPLIYRNELLGVLNVESEQVDAYTENDEEMLGTLGGSLAAIIANARLVEQIRQQADRERIIYEVTSKIRRSTDIQSILTTTASELTRITGSRQTKIKIQPKTDNQEGKS
ncbi:MAG: GAF domain-containing protein [Anaerolineales bacterium]